MGKDPDQIRAEIEQTRDEMGNTVDALAYRADVKTRTKEKVGSAASAVSDKITNVKESIVGTASSAGGSISDSASSAVGSISGTASSAASRIGSATPDGQQVKQQVQRTASLAQENPLGLAVGSVALGFLVGLAFKSTRVEDERLGPIADTVKEKAKETGQEVMERGKQVAQEVSNVAAEHAGQAAQQLTETAQEAAQQVKETAQESGQQQAQELKDSVNESHDRRTAEGAFSADRDPGSARDRTREGGSHHTRQEGRPRGRSLRRGRGHGSRHVGSVHGFLDPRAG